MTLFTFLKKKLVQTLHGQYINLKKEQPIIRLSLL